MTVVRKIKIKPGAVHQPEKRWQVIITYNTRAYGPDIFQVEELDELATIIERGPDWNLIDRIEIRLNRP